MLTRVHMFRIGFISAKISADLLFYRCCVHRVLRFQLIFAFAANGLTLILTLNQFTNQNPISMELKAILIADAIMDSA